jgi:DNA-binding response OmpR family regulator
VVMPLMDGTELLGHLRTRHPQMKVLFTSGDSRRDYFRAAGTPIEEQRMLVKPFTAHELKKRVRETLNPGMAASA